MSTELIVAWRVAGPLDPKTFGVAHPFALLRKGGGFVLVGAQPAMALDVVPGSGRGGGDRNCISKK